MECAGRKLFIRCYRYGWNDGLCCANAYRQRRTGLYPDAVACNRNDFRPVRYPCDRPGVTYTITFQPNTAAAIGTIIVDFCVEDPIPGDTCTNPSGLNLTLSGLGPTGGGLSGWTGIHMIGSHNSTIGWDTTGLAQTPSGATVSMSITGVTNPTATGHRFTAGFNLCRYRRR